MTRDNTEEISYKTKCAYLFHEFIHLYHHISNNYTEGMKNHSYKNGNKVHSLDIRYEEGITVGILSPVNRKPFNPTENKNRVAIGLDERVTYGIY